MPGIGFDLQPLLDDFRSQCRRSGGFDGVVTHELRKAPSSRFVLGAWWLETRTVAARSGLAATSILITLQARIYMPLQGDPDQLDTELWRRVDLIYAAMHAGLTFTADEHEIDVLGAFGDGLKAQGGHLPMPDNTPVRIADINVPIVVNDAYAQVRS
jgi:hypothetical protein